MCIRDREQGYKIYGQNEVKARVSVKGNSLTVNQIKNSDIQVVAQEVSSVSGAGEYTFNLVAVKKGQLTDYEVVSIDPGTVVVEVDKSKEMTLPIESKINYTTDENHYISAPELSTSSVKLSGPETVLNKVCLLYTSYCDNAKHSAEYPQQTEFKCTYYRSNTKRRLGEGIGSVGKLVCCGLSGYCRIFQQRLHYGLNMNRINI